MDQHEEIWLVQLANGSVRVMTLDELDAAFQDGSIDEDTFVRRDGSSKWVRLRDEIGASEPPPAPSYTPPPVYATTPQVQLYSTRPVVSEIDDFELEQPFKKSRKGTWAAVGLIGAAAVAAAVFGAKHFASAPAVNASVVQAAQPQAAPPPPPVTAPQPASTLTEDQKKALSDLDKKHEKTWEQQRVQRQQQHGSHSTYRPSHTPFRKGGNKYDPLNAKL